MDPVFLTVLRAGRPEHTPEAEGALLRCAGEQVIITLDDGEELGFDAVELRKALDEPGDHVQVAA